MQVRVTLATPGPVAFKITDPQGQMLRFPPGIATLSAGDAGVTQTYNFQPPGAASGDTVLVEPPPAGNAPQNHVFTIQIDTSSDFNLSASCSSLMGGAETWTIEVDGGAPLIDGACLLSFDLAYKDFQCQLPRLIPIVSSPLPAITGFPASSSQACATQRPGLDAILVLDKSGSMGSSTLGGSPRPKIDALHDAVKDFVSVWSGLRGTEPPLPPPAPPRVDNLGLVFFDSTVRWASQLGIPAWAGLTPGVHTFDDALRDLVVDNIASVPASGSTAMGGGVQAADGVFNSAGGNRKVVLLMSNGMQNVNPFVGVNDPANPTQVNTYNSSTPGNTTPLPNQANYQIYSLTVGTSTAVSADINMNLAKARGGFYLNSEDNAELLRPFFLELLQNSLHFNSYEIARMISASLGATPFTASFPLSSTARMAAVMVQWRPSAGRLTLTVTPPGGTPQSTTGGAGFAIVRFDLPLSPATNPKTPWQLQVSRPVVELGKAVAEPLPIDITVITDDLAIDSEMTATGQNFVPGEPIRLRARVTEFGRSVRGIGGTAGGQAVVQLVRPGVSIGDLLSNNAATGTQPPGDPATAADAKLMALLEKNPGLLQRVSDTLTLQDDGNGIYSAVFTPTEAGHYNFLFGVEGSGKTGPFSRQQLRTVHVRAIPSAQHTEFQVTSTADHLAIVTTPMTAFDKHVGPGLKNQLWFTAPGIQPVRPVDNLDGTYSVKLPPGSGPVTMHFVDASIVIGDNAGPNDLPGGGLGSDTVVVGTIPGTGSRAAVFFGAGLNAPHGTFGQSVDGGFSLQLGAEFSINQLFSVEGVLGYDRFDGTPDVNITNLTARAKAYMPLANPRIAAFAGMGAYFLDPGGTDFGVSMGGVAEFSIAPQWSVEATYTFHNVSTPNNATRFSTFHGGFRYRF